MLAPPPPPSRFENSHKKTMFEINPSEIQILKTVRILGTPERVEDMRMWNRGSVQRLVSVP